jgi:molybdate transport system regulatory protein
MAETQVSIRVDLESGWRIGPGKITLLEAIRETGSITAAAVAMKMSYRRAWLLVDELNEL